MFSSFCTWRKKDREKERERERAICERVERRGEKKFIFWGHFESKCHDDLKKMKEFFEKKPLIHLL